jgi:hypothetical protein
MFVKNHNDYLIMNLLNYVDDRWFELKWLINEYYKCEICYVKSYSKY